MFDDDVACNPTIGPGLDTQDLESGGSCHDVGRPLEANPAEGQGIIAVIESRVFLRECMCRSVQAAFSIPVIAYSTAQELERQLGNASLRLIILSMLDSNEESAKNCKDLSELLPGVPIIVLGSGNNANLARTVMTYGAKGYISVTAGFESAIAATRFVLAGGTYVPLDIFLEETSVGAVLTEGSHAIGAITRREPSPAHTSDHPASNTLTKRELSVVQRIQKGQSNKIIAYHLNMCESTVKVNVRNIMKKLVAKNRTDIAIKSQSIVNTLNQTAAEAA